VDANGTFFHLLLGAEDWADALAADARLAWDADRSELTLKPHVFLYTAASGDQPKALDQRRGAACDRYGNFYWIDDTQRKVRIRSVGSQVVSDFWPVDEISCPPPAGNAFRPKETPDVPPQLTLSGLTVTEEHYLVVGVLKQEKPDVLAGLLVFDLLSGEPPKRFLWPADVDFAPFDMAPRPGGGVWILDKEHKRYWALDRSFSVLAVDERPEAGAQVFQPPDTPADQPKRFQPHSLLLSAETGAGFPLYAEDGCAGDDCPVPISIEALPDCSVLILNNQEDQYSTISRYDSFGNKLGGPLSIESIRPYLETGKFDEEQDIKALLTAHDFAFLPLAASVEHNVLGRLFIVSQNGNQSFAFTLLDQPFRLEPVYEEGCMLMRLFDGKALIACGDSVYYDIGERWVPLVNQPRLRYDSTASFSRRFDGKEPGCVWHRVMLDACIPPDTQVQISSRASDDQADLALLPWQPEYLYLRGDGSELPFAPNPFRPQSADETGLLQSVDRQAQVIGAGTWELLFQRANGRYLELRVELLGQEQRTPRLREMRVYYPRFSYLERYLPAVYRADSESASFLDRYLANPEGFYTAIEDKIVAARQLFDVDSTPPEALDWLANWFGAALHPGWDDTRRRLFIRHAALLFQYRGTLPGLQMALRLALEDCPGDHIFQSPPAYREGHGLIRIVEAFLSRRFGRPANAEAGLAPSGYWTPDLGSAELHRRYQVEFDTPDPYPIREPDGELGRHWRDFSQRQLGFVPSDATLLLWQAYLLRTYGQIDKFNSAYELHGEAQLDSFDEAVLPEELPNDGAPLKDWYRFETEFLPLARNAHQFSVLLPIRADSGPDTLENQRRLSLAVQMVELEKPAHTTYAIRFFWALFRVGEVRLGLDTTLDADSRSAQLIPPLVLGQGYLGQSNMADDIPRGFGDRVALAQGCAPNVESAARSSAQKMTVKRYPYSYGCASNS